MKQIKTNKEMIEALNANFDIPVWEAGGVVLIGTADGDTINGNPIGDYYGTDEEIFINGKNIILVEWCEKHGWYLEWESPEAICATRN